MPLRAAEIEALVTVNTDDVGRAEKDIKSTGQRIEKNPLKVDADAKGAIASLDRVDAEAKKLVSKPTAVQVNARIESAEKSFKRVYERLEYLRSVEADVDVKADVARAEANLQKIQRSLDGLRNARAKMVVDVDDDPAKQKLQAVEDYAGEAGADAGDEMGDSLINALTAIPIAGAVVGIGILAGKAILDGFNKGLQVEVRYDRLAALAGLDETDARRLGLAAGEAYANTFGESIEANMDTTRLALQFDILDEDATTRDAQKVIQGLSGIAGVLEEEVRPTAQAVSIMLSTGIAKSADHAFDILAAGAREGTNRAEDLLDTFTEYPALFARLGLSGDEALGLINQGMKAGARNSDLVADALKELQIRSTDASKTSAEGYRLIGLDAEAMTSKMARGGAEAREGLNQILDGLRNIEDPVARNAAGVALVGTQWEDLGDAVLALDLSTAVAQLEGVTGSAQKMFDALSDNDATKVEQAQRNIEVAVDGIQGALAGAFSEPLGDFADWVSQNRGPLLSFFQDLVNGALDFAEGATESVGAFVSGPLAEMVSGLAVAIKFFDWGADTSELDALAESMRGFEGTTDAAVDKIEEMRGQFNGFADGQVALGYLNDAALRTADAIGKVGSEHGTMEEQVRRAVAAMGEEISAAEAAGESQTNLTDRYNTSTQALVDQMVQSGMTREAAQQLIDTVLQTPPTAETTYSSNAPTEQAKVQSLADRITTLPDGSVVVTADTSPARNGLEGFIQSATGRRIAVYVDAYGGRSYQNEGSSIRYQAGGGVLEFMAAGGIPGLTPMQSTADVVPSNTWRVVGDRGDVPESFIPWDGSDRSRQILDRTNEAFGVTSSKVVNNNLTVVNPVVRDLQQDAWEAAQNLGGDL
ncbi:phage tail tape measure protein [Microbacterium sp. NPDC058389]|uniref:phage tail tape measure protein n=1 Tax=Microbacterium sp. NPDC058389 TaxID=3346475 RepID=UPI003664DFE5